MKKRKGFLAMLIIGLLGIALVTLAMSSHRASGRSSKIRRTILLKFKPEATDADVQKVLQDVKTNISSLKGVHNLVVGAQTIDRTPFRYGISMDFDDADALKAYRQNEEHRRTHNDYNHLIEQAQISDILDE